MIEWPPTLVSEVAERRCIIVMGAGASAGSLSPEGQVSPKTWRQLLESARDKLVKDQETIDLISTLITQSRYLEAAEVIHAASHLPVFYSFLEQEFGRPKFQPSAVHTRVLELDPKIVITTNYDKIFEQLCEASGGNDGYRTFRYHDPMVLHGIRSRKRVILKMHGCVSAPEGIVLTRGQYFLARSRYPEYYNVLDALFLVHTLLFIGCGLHDPDLALLLETAHIAAQSEHPHYAVVPAGQHPAVKKSITTTYNLELLEYPLAVGHSDEHAELVASLADLVEQVKADRALPT